VTELCGVILHPAGHTLSPVLHAEAYRALEVDAVYLPFDVPPADLPDALAGMRALRVRQLSVSIPHKEAVLALADQISDDARRIGAANTLTRTPNGILASNTDWLGVLRCLEPLGPWSGRRATVLGAGGAARAVVFALRELGMAVSVANRTRERAERLVRDLGGEVRALPGSGNGRSADLGDLLVNTTPVGMAPDLDGLPLPPHLLTASTTVFDTVYRPLETRLLREARERGCATIDGLGMLVHQAVEQIRQWTGRAPDPAALRAAAERWLRERDVRG
jgi:shikimate dehydrogenase